LSFFFQKLIETTYSTIHRYSKIVLYVVLYEKIVTQYTVYQFFINVIFIKCFKKKFI